MINYLSYSMLRTYRGCGYAFKRRYIDRDTPTPGVVNHRNFSVGDVCHQCMNKWIVQAKCNPDWMLTVWESVWAGYLKENPVTFLNLEDEGVLRDRVVVGCTKIQESFFRSGLCQHEINSETKFKVWSPSLKIFLGGRVDIIDWTEKVILDLKVTENPRFFDEDQGAFYLIAQNLALNGLIFTRFFEFVPLRREDFIEYVFSLEELRVFWQSVIFAVQQIRAGEFPFAEDKSNCYNCDWRDKCPDRTVAVLANTQVETTDESGRKKAVL